MILKLSSYPCNRTQSERKKIIVHIGTHKTGSTSIQNALRRQERMLRKCGILVPLSGTLGRLSGHHNIAWEMRRDPLFTPGCGGVDDLILELGAARESVAVISSEDFEYLVKYPKELGMFNEKIVNAGYDPLYLVFFRDPSAYLESLFHQLKKDKVEEPFEWFLNEYNTKGYILVHGDWYYDLDAGRFAKEWRDIVGPNVLVVNYDEVSKNPGLLPFFFKSIGASAKIVEASANMPRLNRRIVN
jgi:hypothetical protein